MSYAGQVGDYTVASTEYVGQLISAEGAPFNSHGREAVVNIRLTKPRPEGPTFTLGDNRNAAPSALDSFALCRSTA